MNYRLEESTKPKAMMMFTQEIGDERVIMEFCNDNMTWPEIVEQFKFFLRGSGYHIQEEDWQ